MVLAHSFQYVVRFLVLDAFGLRSLITFPKPKLGIFFLLVRIENVIFINLTYFFSKVRKFLSLILNTPYNEGMLEVTHVLGIILTWLETYALR